MSSKNHSLALDETVKGFDHNTLYDNNFEPELTVIVGAHYAKAPIGMASNDVVYVDGSITVSF